MDESKNNNTDLTEAIAEAVSWARKDLIKNEPSSEGLSKPAADTIAATIDKISEYVSTADKRLTDLYQSGKLDQIKEVLPDIEQWLIDNLTEDPSRLLWIAFFTDKILFDNLEAIRNYIELTGYNGSTADFVENGPEDKDTGDLLPGHLEKALLIADGFTLDEVNDRLPTEDNEAAEQAAEVATREDDPMKTALASYFNIAPNAPLSDLIFEILIQGSQISSLPAKKRVTSHGGNYEVAIQSGHYLRVTRKTATDEYIVEHPDVEKLAGSNKSVKKIYVLILMKANEQAFYNGRLYKDHVTFPLQELVDLGIYKSLDAARNGFYDAMDVLTFFRARGRQKWSKGVRESSAQISMLFYDARISNNECIVSLNTKVDWSFLIEYFAIMPPFYFSLPNKASDLLYYIFYLARQNTRKIRQQGYFNISFRAIQARLGLPNEVGCKNPGRDIRKPIEDAIEQIEEANSAYYNNTDFTMLPVYEDGDRVPIANFLDNGYLRIEFRGLPASFYRDLQKRTEKQITASKKKGRSPKKSER